MAQLILASASPRREELLTGIGIPFEAVPSTVDEASLPARGGPEDTVEEAACAKAVDVALRRPDTLVVACDTIVVVDGHVLGKPADRDEAVQMVLRLAGREHEVLTGLFVVAHSAAVALSDRGAEGGLCPADRRLPAGEPGGWSFAPLPGAVVGAERTLVRFGALSEGRAREYVAQGESLDKAGAYGIQGKAGLLVEAIQGCYFNVVGLPLYRLADLLAAFEIDLLTGAGLERL